MDFSITFLLYTTTKMFCTSKISTVSYGEYFSVSFRFVIFLSVVTICDVETEYEINVSLSYLLLDHFAKNILSCMNYAMLFAAYFNNFILATTLLFVIGHLSVSEFLDIIYFIIIETWLFFFNYLASVFIEVSQLVSLVIFLTFKTSICQKYFYLWLYLPQFMQVPLYWVLHKGFSSYF